MTTCSSKGGLAATIGASVFALEPFLREFASRSSTRSIYLVAHSGGLVPGAGINQISCAQP